MNSLEGIFAASITPLNKKFSPDLEAIPLYLDFLAGRGCHGALLLGTTGEGPSFSFQQRIEIMKAGLRVREKWPNFKLLAGTSTPSLDETCKLTKKAFDLDMDGVVVLPPYYYRRIDNVGLYSWYCEVIDRSVPEGGCFLAYHIPAVSGVGLSINLLEGLVERNPSKFSGLKDSSGDIEFAKQLGDKFGDELSVFTGNDLLLTEALNNQASGCITAMANLISPELHSLWESFQLNETVKLTQERINHVRKTCEQYQPFPPLIKLLMNKYFDFPLWPVCPPLVAQSEETADQLSTLFNLA